MKESLQIVSKISSWFERIWFSDTLMRIFIVFPTGMRVVMALSITMSCLEPGNPLYIFFSLLFLLACLITVLMGFRRSWNNNGNTK
jgi:hypothetical protein